MGLLDLFVAATIPVLNVLIVTGVGAFLATGRINILGADARHHLNNVVFYVFNPSLVASNLSRTITFDSMVLLWFMPFNVFFTFIIGSALGWVLVKITKAPSHLKGLIFGCCAAGNLGNILLIIVPAICKEKGSPFGDPDTCRTYGLTYVSLSMALGAIFLWSYVYNIVRISSTAKEDEGNGHGPIIAQSDVTSRLLTRNHDGSITSPGDLLMSEASTNEYAISVPTSFSSGKTKVSASVKIKLYFQKISGIIDLRKLLAPSTIGVIIGFIIGVVPQIRKTLIGEDAPLRVIQDAATVLSDGAIPTLTLILGGNLITGLRGANIRTSLIVGVIAVRYIALPLIGVVIVKGAVRLGLVHSDPLYQFVLLIQYAVPPAMNIGTITQLFGTGESECSVIFLWTYALASVAVTLWSTYFMWLVS
ncbi:hypothetical protein QJS10_CPB22g01531 [Acorus calamus]|uniref:Uncharacterized protein n=1 Tax=Acorus calamus TaxID=4465 RepID=A0AAV9BYV4_ACOCL|nr:hypothetical protein QJS10_CPB22g01531 [Acorus calamus]